MKYLLSIVLIFCVAAGAWAQAKVRKLPTSINHPGINLYAPFISADGNALIFISDNNEDGALGPFFTMREGGDWKQPQSIPKPVSNRLNFLRGYSFNSDGKKIFLSSMKSPSVGGFDLYTSELKGYTWSEPANMLKPINSPKHEACASFTTDERTMFFMRCEKMDVDKADQCKLFFTKRKNNGQWEEPVELPANVNTGNSQTPRIMGDGETLIFSSNKLTPNKGGMDLYMTRQKADGTWTNPVALDFTNTDKDDQYITVAALGRYLLRDTPGPRKNELVEFLFPPDVKPKGAMKVEGKVVDASGSPAASYVSAVDLDTRRLVYNAKPSSDGTFLLYLKEGAHYELSVDPEQDQLSFFTKGYDLTREMLQADKLNVVIKPVVRGDEMTLNAIAFQNDGITLDKGKSTDELGRVARILNANKSLKADFAIDFSGYREDSIAATDLSQIRYDSSIMQVSKPDSVAGTITVDSVVVKSVFHNDQTEAQARALIAYLVSQGVSEQNLSFSKNLSLAVLPEERKTLVKIRFK